MRRMMPARHMMPERRVAPEQCMIQVRCVAPERCVTLAQLLLAFAFALAAMFFGLASGFASPAYAAENTNMVNPQQRPDSSFIYDTLISDLAQADAYLDGETVQVTGEVVGDSIRAEFDEGYRWITLQADDGSYAQIAVFMTEDSAGRIDTFGAYGKVGTTLQVRGVFNLACPDHEGLSDLHANHVLVVEAGQVLSREFDYRSFIPGAGLVLLGAVLVLVFYRMRERQR